MCGKNKYLAMRKLTLHQIPPQRQWLNLQNYSLAADLFILTLAFIAGVLLSSILIEILGYYDQTLNATRHGSAVKIAGISKNIVPGNTGDNSPAAILTTTKVSSYGGAGQSDVETFKFMLTPNVVSRLQSLQLELDNFARPSDVMSVQLYFENNLVADVPFFEGKAIFENLRVGLKQNSPNNFTIKAKISDQAFVGDRLGILIKDSPAIKLFDDEANELTIKNQFPIRGGHVSIVGGLVKGSQE